MRVRVVLGKAAAFVSSLLFSSLSFGQAAVPPSINATVRQVVLEWQVRPTPGQQSRRSANAGLPTGYWYDNRVKSQFFIRSDIPEALAPDLSVTIMQDRRRARDEALLPLAFTTGTGEGGGMAIPKSWFDAGRRLYIGRVTHPSGSFWEDVVSGHGVNSFSIDIHASRVVRRRAVPLASSPGSGATAAWQTMTDGSAKLVSSAGEDVLFRCGRMDGGRGGATYFDSPVGPGTLSVVVRSSVTFEPDTLQSIRWRPELIVAADTPGGRVRRATTLSAIPRDAEESPTFFEVPLEVDIPAGKTVRIIVSASHLTKVSGNPRHSPTARIAATFTPARPGEDPDSPDDDNPDDDEPTSPAIPTGNCVALNGQFQSLFGGSLYSLTDSEGASPVAELSRPAERLCASATAPVSGQMTITGVATPRSGNIPTDVLIDVYVNDRHRGTFASARQSVRTLAVDAGDRIRVVEALDLSRSGAGSVPFPLLFTAVVQIIPD